MASRWRDETATEMNLAPLLDVIFCLLFFFVLATSIRREREALNVELPRTRQDATALDQSLTLEVVITDDNRIVFEGETLIGSELGGRLESARRQEPARAGRVVIRTDDRASVQTLMEVSDACAEAGFETAMMETEAVPVSGAAP